MLAAQKRCGFGKPIFMTHLPNMSSVIVKSPYPLICNYSVSALFLYSYRSMKAASLKFCTEIYKAILKMFLWLCLKEVTAKFGSVLSQDMSKFKPGVFKFYMLNI